MQRVPRKAQAKPKQPRRMLVTNLSMRDGKPVRGSSAATIPPGNYAIQQMGKVTGAYEAVFNDDIEMFRPANIKQFDAICFNNTLGVLFDDPELRASLLGFVESGKGFVGIHDAIATFVQYPKYDQWPEFGRMLGGTENGGHPWNGEVMTMKVEDPSNPINAAFGGKDFQIADQAFQLQEPVLRDRLHVLLRIDAEKTGPPRRILPAREAGHGFPNELDSAAGQRSRVLQRPRARSRRLLEPPDARSTCWPASSTRWAISRQTTRLIAPEGVERPTCRPGKCTTSIAFEADFNREGAGRA